MSLFWNIARPIAFCFQPETAHHLAFSLLKPLQSTCLIRRSLRSLQVVHSSLETQLFGLHFPNPVGLAAGLDKDAELIPTWESLGFGFAEVGTLTPKPQPGNLRPRLFRIPPDRAIINRMGFNNFGALSASKQLTELRTSSQPPQIPIGVNLGKNKVTPNELAVQDYLSLFDVFFDLADYLVINVSSPNTPGLRALQEKSKLDEIFSALQEKNQGNCPLLLKIAPDLEWSQLDDVLEICLQRKLSGIIATNTTLSRQGIRSHQNEVGGLSGHPLKEKSTEFIRVIYRNTSGKLPIIGVGGIFNAEDAYQKVKAGASLVQVYTGLIYQGPTLCRDINRELIRLLQRDGFKSITEAVGCS